MKILGCLLVGSAWLSAAPVTVLSYDMLNGEKHTFSYMDKSYNGAGDRTLGLSPLSGGKGLLTDGATGITDFTANLGNGQAYEWVGWAKDGGGFSAADPTDSFATITFRLASASVLNSISLFINNYDGAVPVGSGVGIFKTATISFSNDGVNFVSPITYTSTAADIADTNARYFNIALNGVNPFQYVQVHLTHQATENWVFLSEVTLDGRGVAVTTPEPASAMLAVLGLVGLVLNVRRKRQLS